MTARRLPLPHWVEITIVPLVNVGLALLATGFVVLLLGESPLRAFALLLNGALGSGEALGYTLYYATNFIFTGLAVALAYHAGLFNIGGEGQAYIGGLGVGLAMLAFDSSLPTALLVPLALVASGLFGAAWAFIPAWLQAYRGSHIVITTIMFNFLAAALMVYLMVDVLIVPGSMAPESRSFAPVAELPTWHGVLRRLGYDAVTVPLNASLLWALLSCLLVWVFLWHSRWGFELRTVGQSERAAVYAGIAPKRVVILAMCFSGALAGFVGLNEILGVHHRLMLNFTNGYGFTGIAVALMGRNHPVGIVLASLLFGTLYQGGAELTFDMPKISREMVLVIQGLVILFSGALAYMSLPWVEKVYSLLVRPRSAPSEEPAA